MSRIHILDELTANQIAAGEVIERPGSVVKELVENSLDADSGSISVEISDGGLSSIKVSDDGCGMSEGDLLLAVQRHATSKLTGIDDLNELRTLGFRGEALASIFAVSITEITTREKDSESGIRLLSEGNHHKLLEPVGAPVGTTFKVENLFFNTPARKEFMRSTRYEGGLIHELMMHFSLSFPHVCFKLTNQGKEILNTAGINTIPELLASYYGRDITESLLEINETLTKVKVNGYITEPTKYRANRKGIHFFVNNRKVSSKELSLMIDEAYANILPKGRFPVAVFNLHIEPSLIDVNVHPSKLEIRFRETRFLSEVTEIVKSSLSKSKRIPYYDIGKKPFSANSFTKIFTSPPKNEYLQEELSSFSVKRKPEQEYELPLNSSVPPKLSVPPKSNAPTKTESQPLAEPDIITDIIDSSAETAETKNTLDMLSDLRVIGQLDATFILAEGRDGLYIIDQHVAHERVIFEQLLKEHSQKGKLQSQLLLTPITLELSALEEELVVEHILPLTDMGLILEHFGQRSYLIRAVPSCLREDPLDFFQGLLEDLNNATKKISGIDIKREFLVMASCKAAIKAHQKLSISSMEDLIRDLLLTDNPLTCPHGRPIIYKISYRELLKAFHRI